MQNKKNTTQWKFNWWQAPITNCSWYGSTCQSMCEEAAPVWTSSTCPHYWRECSKDGSCPPSQSKWTLETGFEAAAPPAGAQTLLACFVRDGEPTDGFLIYPRSRATAQGPWPRRRGRPMSHPQPLLEGLQSDNQLRLRKRSSQPCEKRDSNES